MFSYEDEVEKKQHQCSYQFDIDKITKLTYLVSLYMHVLWIAAHFENMNA